MRTLFVCYALEPDHIEELRDRLARIDAGATAAGWRSYAHVRDTQSWSFHNASIREVLGEAFRRIACADAVLLDLTSHTNSKRVGLNIEAGYAAALGKPIIAVYHESDRPNMTADLADYECAYRDVVELNQLTAKLVDKISIAG